MGKSVQEKKKRKRSNGAKTTKDKPTYYDRSCHPSITPPKFFFSEPTLFFVVLVKYVHVQRTYTTPKDPKLHVSTALGWAGLGC